MVHFDTTDRMRARWRDERGTALLITLMMTMLLSAMGMALVLVTNTETAITENHRTAQQSLYAADAGVERVMHELLAAPNWNDLLNGTTKSAFISGTLTPTLPDGTPLDLNVMTSLLQSETNSLNLWGANNPQWRLYAYGPMSEMLPGGTIDNATYVAVWVGDDPSEFDGNPQFDSNGVLSFHAEAYGPSGARKVVEMTISRTDTTEIERGFIAQRGQEELNQRGRKAAVQSPGKGLTRMSMSLAAGGF